MKPFSEMYKEYYGVFYYLEGDDNFKKKLFNKLKLLIFMLIAFSIIGGLVRFDGMLHNHFLLIFYMLEIIDILIMANSLYILTSRKGVLTEKEYHKTIDVFNVYVILLYIFLVLSFIGSIVYVIIEGFHNDVLWFIFYLLLKPIMFYLAYIFKKSTSNLSFDERENYE